MQDLWTDSIVRPVHNADPERLVDWFDDFDGPNRYAFLSNFYEAEVKIWGHMFPTTEHAFAWMKPVKDDPMRPEIRTALGPGAAKSLGRACVLRPEWEEIKFRVMQAVVRAKFDQHPDLARSLMDTGDAYLQEGTYWDDRVWGVDLLSAPLDWERREGLNWLGTILMAERARLRLIWS